MILGAIWFSMADTQTLQDTTTALTSVLGGGLLGLFMFGMLTTRGDSRAAICGILCTLVFVTWAVLAGNGLLPSWLRVPFNLTTSTWWAISSCSASATWRRFCSSPPKRR